jgi:hypothetical protein
VTPGAFFMRRAEKALTGWRNGGGTAEEWSKPERENQTGLEGGSQLARAR